MCKEVDKLVEAGYPVVVNVSGTGEILEVLTKVGRVWWKWGITSERGRQRYYSDNSVRKRLLEYNYHNYDPSLPVAFDIKVDIDKVVNSGSGSTLLPFHDHIMQEMYVYEL